MKAYASVIPLYLALVSLAKSEEIKSTPHVRQIQWCLKFDKPKDDSNEERFIELYRAPSPQALVNGELIKDYDDTPRLKLNRADAQKAFSIVYKFSQWAEVAKRNSVKEYAKELGELHFEMCMSDKVYFVVSGMTRAIVIKGFFNGPVMIDESEAPAIMEVLKKLPTAEQASKTRPKNRIDPTDSLFK